MINILNVVTCAVLSLEDGQIDYTEAAEINGEYPVGTVASFSCNSGLSLSGSESSICQMSGNWKQQSQICNAGKMKYYKLTN